MDVSTHEIATKSLEVENDFSSASHALSTMVYETTQEATETYTIPTRYYKDTVTLLAANTNTYYVYWEIIEATLQSYNLDLYKQKLCFRVENTQGQSLVEFESPFDLGEYFFTINAEDMDICVKMGLIRDNQFVEIMHSNVLHTFSSTIKLPDFSNEVWLEKNPSYMKIIQSHLEEINNVESSTSNIKQFERLLFFSDMLEKRKSSSSFLGLNND